MEQLEVTDQITRDDIDFISKALNAYWNAAHDKLENPKSYPGGVGDLEKQSLEYNKRKSKDLMERLGNLREKFSPVDKTVIVGFLEDLEKKKPNWSAEQMRDEVEAYLLMTSTTTELHTSGKRHKELLQSFIQWLQSIKPNWTMLGAIAHVPYYGSKKVGMTV